MSDATSTLLEELDRRSPAPSQERPLGRSPNAVDVRALVERARQDFAKDIPVRYRELVFKKQEDELTDAEREELAKLTDQMELAWADRLQALSRKVYHPRVPRDA
jgi:hypothetical protein